MTRGPNISGLKKKILDISYDNKLSHLGSCLTALPIIYEIYREKKEEDLFILSSGHAGLALYVVLESLYNHIDAEQLLHKHGIHPCKDEVNKVHCSTGSLGLGLPIAVGRALANKDRNIYCLISDGECAEGSIWESLAFIQNKKIDNIKVYANINGYSAYDELDSEYLKNRLLAFLPSIKIRETNFNDYDFLNGVDAHYHVVTEKDYVR